MSNQNKIPIYPDEAEYRIVDAVSESSESHQLQPSNTAARKLCRCIECLKDVLTILETAQQIKAKDKLQRQLKQLFTPLFSFVECLVDLLHDIQSNPDTKRRLPPGVFSSASQMEKRLKENIPPILRTIRDKISAHIDKNMHPSAVQKLFSKVQTNDAGWWLHCSLAVFSDTLKLPIYQWSCESRFPDCIGIMSPDMPILTILCLDGTKLSHIVGVILVKNDPRMEVLDLVKEVVRQSRWMFRAHDPQISHFLEDTPGSNWAKSLETLPKTIIQNYS